MYRGVSSDESEFTHLVLHSHTMTSQTMIVVENDAIMIRIECRMGWVLLEYGTNDTPLAITRLVQLTLLLVRKCFVAQPPW